MGPIEVECPVCKAKPYATCRDHKGVPMHLKHDLRRRKAYAMTRKKRKAA